MHTAIFSRFRSPWLWLATGLALVYLRGLFLNVMDVDASQYASISMEMLQSGTVDGWLQVQHRGADYLDKPPLLFWLSASSFALFGLSNWAYKLPSLLAALAGIWATYRFARLFYGEKTARIAGFMLAASLGLIVICNDVRTDTLLLGATACAVWQLAEYLESGRWRNLFAGFFCIGLAMLAKGPIGLVMPAFAVGTHLLARGEWRQIFRWQWLPGLLVTALVLAPMCWGLWQQFDLHPEKLVNGRQGVSGLRFYFWEQSFGRITGENVWKNDASVFYFLHVYLWAFLPWCLLLPLALWQRLRALLASMIGQRELQEVYSLGGFILTFVALSLAQYKLPHYIFITLPWAAVLVAIFLTENMLRRVAGILLLLASLVALFAGYLVVFFVFPSGNFWAGAVLLAASALLIWRLLKKPRVPDCDKLVQGGVAVMVVTGIVLNFHFYPNLLPYQSTSQVAAFARSKGVPPGKMYFFARGGHALDFYNGDILEGLESPERVETEARNQGAIWVFTTEKGKEELQNAGLMVEETGRFPHFQVALLKPKFLNPATRAETLADMFLIKICYQR